MVYWQYNDGGRAAAGYKGEAGDCVTRAIAIATGDSYQSVYDALSGLMKSEPVLAGGKRSPRRGVPRQLARRYLEGLGATWVPTMKIGSGCRVHLRDDELPKGRLVVVCSRHYVAMIDGVIHDTFDPSRDGTRCVYGYYIINQRRAA